jgi:hypothetical protein
LYFPSGKSIYTFVLVKASKMSTWSATGAPPYTAHPDTPPCLKKCFACWNTCTLGRQHTSAYVSMCQHTSAYVSIRQHTSAYVSIRQHTSALVKPHKPAYVSIRQHTSVYVSIRQHTACWNTRTHNYRAGMTTMAMRPAYVSIRQHTSAYVSIRQQTSAYACYLHA